MLFWVKSATRWHFVDTVIYEMIQLTTQFVFLGFSYRVLLLTSRTQSMHTPKCMLLIESFPSHDLAFHRQRTSE